jgi:hypothetical protein
MTRFISCCAFLLCALMLSSQNSIHPSPTATVTELPPEAIPVGTCTQSTTGYLGIVEPDKKERTKLTDQEIGEYVQKKLAEGYSIALYPQASGKIFTFQTCHPTKP